MDFIYDHLIQAMWVCWLVYWRVSAGNVKRTARKESPASRASHFIPLGLGILVLCWPDRDEGPLFALCWPRTIYVFWLGVAILAVGFVLAVWARRVLGRNWSNAVTVKENHELIQSGPYAAIRHPIYTGLLLGFLGTAVTMSEWRGLVAWALMFLAFSIKLRVEERWMTEVFGQAYAAYRQRTGMLLPRIA